MAKEKRINLRSTVDEERTFRAAAEADSMDLSTWMRRLAWREVKRVEKKNAAAERPVSNRSD